jgi:hypothetical protein
MFSDPICVSLTALTSFAIKNFPFRVVCVGVAKVVFFSFLPNLF